MSLILTPLGTDNFTPDANPVNPAKWTEWTHAPGDIGPLQAVSGKAEGQVADIGLIYDGDYYSGITAPDDQYITVSLDDWIVGNGQEADIVLRSDLTSNTDYVAAFIFDNGDGTATIRVTGLVASVIFSLYEDAAAIVAPSDTFTFAAIGQSVYFFHNGVQVPVATGITIPASGVAGLFALTGVGLSDVSFSNFIVGHAAIPPTLTPGATDNFTPDANPLNPAKWTKFTGPDFAASLRAVSGQAVGQDTALAGLNGNYYSASVAPDDQFITATLARWIKGNAQAADVFLRSDPTGETTFLDFNVSDAGDGIHATVAVINGDGSSVFYQNLNAIVNAGDVFSFAVIANTGYLAQNGVWIAAFVIAGATSGASGLSLLPNITVDDCAWSNFITGSAAIVPPSPGGGGDGSFGFGYDFKFRHGFAGL